MKPRTTTDRGITYRQENHFFFERVPEDEYHPLYGWIILALALLSWVGIGYGVYRIFETLAS